MNKPFHPLLFAIYPVLFLYSQNTAEFPPDVLFWPMLVCVGITILLAALLSKFSSNVLRSTFLLSFFLLMFFSYGHFYHWVEQSEISADPKIVLTLYGALFLILMIVFYKTIRDWKKATSLFNMMSIGLVLLALFSCGTSLLKTRNLKPKITSVHTRVPISDAPDIFYIILDGYPRKETLQDIHKFDNSEFLNFLSTRGFRILENSTSNYPGTAPSLASSLNFSYLDTIVPAEEIKSGNRWFLKKLIERNQAMEFLKQQGYVTAAFDSGYFTTEIKGVDRFYATGWFLNEFHEALLDTTPAWVIFKNVGRYGMQRRRILHILDHLAEIKDSASPVFVFAHVMALHPPFVFGPNGEERKEEKSSLKFWQDFGAPSPQQLSQQYQDQLQFINKKVQSAVDAILANRSRPVLIVLQGDHGSSFVTPDREQEFYQERFSILNAIRLPHRNQMYDSMTPVNTFRVIFNSIFGTSLPLLNDRSFYSKRDRPYEWKEVTAHVVQ